MTSPTIDEAWSYVESLDPDLPLAFDIETDYSTRNDEDERVSFVDRNIRLIQFSQQRGTGIALPWRDEFIEVAKATLAKCRYKVGFNNFSFDDPVLAANGVDVGKTDDAMVEFGVYYSDLPKNLQTAAQFCGYPFPWKALSDSDLALYGCIDADATLCVHQHMQKLLASVEVSGV